MSGVTIIGSLITQSGVTVQSNAAIGGSLTVGGDINVTGNINAQVVTVPPSNWSTFPATSHVDLNGFKLTDSTGTLTLSANTIVLDTAQVDTVIGGQFTVSEQIKIGNNPSGSNVVIAPWVTNYTINLDTARCNYRYDTYATSGGTLVTGATSQIFTSSADVLFPKHVGIGISQQSDLSAGATLTVCGDIYCIGSVYTSSSSVYVGNVKLSQNGANLDIGGSGITGLTVAGTPFTPNWSGVATSSLDMCNFNISNVTNLSASNLSVSNATTLNGATLTGDLNMGNNDISNISSAGVLNRLNVSSGGFRSALTTSNIFFTTSTNGVVGGVTTNGTDMQFGVGGGILGLAVDSNARTTVSALTVTNSAAFTDISIGKITQYGSSAIVTVPNGGYYDIGGIRTIFGSTLPVSNLGYNVGGQAAIGYTVSFNHFTGGNGGFSNSLYTVTTGLSPLNNALVYNNHAQVLDISPTYKTTSNVVLVSVDSGTGTYSSNSILSFMAIGSAP